MRSRRTHLLATLAIAALLFACASLDPEPDFQQVQALVSEGSGAAPSWQRSPADEAAARERVQMLLADGLTRDEAMQIALLNDPRLQAQFDELGIARAEYVQAGLYSNPELAAFIGIPISFATPAITLVTMLSDLWVVPAREAVAETALRRTIQETGAAALATAFDAAEAYDEVLRGVGLLDLEQRLLALQRSANEREAETPRRETGAERDAREAATRATLADQEIAEVRAELALAQARNRLAQNLNLPSQLLEGALVGAREEPGPEPPDEQEAVAFALERRLDLAAAKLRAEEARRRATLAQRSLFSGVELGPSYQGDFDVANSAGPAFSLALPIFDRQQAALAAAAFEEQRSLHQVDALEAQTRREVADAIAEAASLRRENDIRRAEASPALLRALETTRPGPASDLDEYLGWLRSQTEAIEAQRKQLEVGAELRRAQRRLQRVLFVSAHDGS